jgi:hypothetical protein
LQFVERYATAYVALMRGGVGSDREVAGIIEKTRAAYMDRLTSGLAEIFPAKPARPAVPKASARRPRTPVRASLSPLLRTALRGWLGFVEATSLEWAVGRDVPRPTLVTLLVQMLLHTLQAAGTPAP